MSVKHVMDELKGSNKLCTVYSTSWRGNVYNGPVNRIDGSLFNFEAFIESNTAEEIKICIR